MQMDQQTQQKLERYVSLFELTFSAKNNEDRKNAEKEIEQASQEDQNFFQCLITLLIMEQTPTNIKKAASNYIITLTRAVIVQENFGLEVKQKMSQLFFEALIEPKINSKYKSSIQISLESILQFDQTNEIKLAMYNKLLEILQTNDASQMIGCFISLTCIVNATRQFKHLEKIINSIIDPICNTVLNIINPLEAKFKELAESKAQIDDQTLLGISQGIEILKTWGTTIGAFQFKCSDAQFDPYKQLMKTLVINNKVGLVIMKILELQYNTEFQIQECFISTSDVMVIDTQLNDLKTTVMQQYNKINKFMFDQRGKINFKEAALFQMLSQVLPGTMKSIYNFCSKAQQTLFTVIEKSNIKNVMVESLNFLKICGNQQQFYHIYSTSRIQLLMNVILPLISTTPEETDQFENSPQEFFNLALDTCDKQFSQTYKTAAAQVLEVLCDNYDGAMTMVASVCISIIKYSLIKVYNPQTQEQYQDHPDFPALKGQMDSIFIKHLSAEQRIETCFLAFSIMSYFVPQRTDLVSEIEKLVIENIQYLFNPQQPSKILKSRICLFFGYYYDTILQDDEHTQNFMTIVQFLISCILEDQSEAVNLQANDSLINVYMDDQNTRLQGTIVQVFQMLVDKISIQGCHILELIHTILQYYPERFYNSNELIVNCIGQLIEKIKLEYQLIQEQKKINERTMNFSWNIIRQVIDNDQFYSRIGTQLEQLLFPILQTIQHYDQISFEDEIVLIIQGIVTHRKTVPNEIGSLLVHFEGVFKKQKMVFGHLMQCISHIIQYGQVFFSQQSEVSNNILQVLLNLAGESINATGFRINEADNAEGALIMQLIIHHYGTILQNHHWQFIFTKTIERLNKKITNNFFYGRLIGVFLISFKSNYDVTQSVLSEQLGIFGQVIKAMFHNIEYYSTPHDIKMFVVCGSYIMMQNNMLQEMQQFLPQLLDYIVTLLKKQENENKKNKEKVQNRNQQQDDDDDDDDDLQFQADEVMEDKIQVEYIETPYKEEDEFEFFRNTIFQIKEKDQSVLMNFVNTLQEEKVNYLKTLMSVKRVGASVRVIRRRKK